VVKMEQEQEERSRITYEVGQVGRFVNAARLELVIETEAGISANRTVIVDGDGFRIGSNESCELVLNDRSVSRFHCRLVHDRRGWRVTDIDSLNGVKLQGVRIMDAYLPGPECTLQLGDSVVRVRERPSHETIPVSASSQHGELFGHSLTMRKLFALIDRVAKSDTNVLIEGESGTGKERVATEIVRGGTRANKPFIIVDCSAISPNLIESELFGHIRGAFTGAERDRVGAFEAANGGTVFLDEVGELPLDFAWWRQPIVGLISKSIVVGSAKTCTFAFRSSICACLRCVNGRKTSSSCSRCSLRSLTRARLLICLRRRFSTSCAIMSGRAMSANFVTTSSVR
jgi:pSer/pThr/pTyr-binding forkhead associated (FHA) protein